MKVLVLTYAQVFYYVEPENFSIQLPSNFPTLGQLIHYFHAVHVHIEIFRVQFLRPLGLVQPNRHHGEYRYECQPGQYNSSDYPNAETISVAIRRLGQSSGDRDCVYEK